MASTPLGRAGRLARAVALGAAALLLVAADEASAADDAAASSDIGPHRSRTIGLGLMGLVGATILDSPSDQTVTVGGVRGRPVELADDAGFVGLSAGGGVAFELRAFRYFGLELDVIRSRDSGSAELTVNRLGATHTFTLEISDVAWHFPLLLKGVLPTDWVRPFILLGPELVLPEETDATVEGDLPSTVEYRALPRSHMMLTAGLGAELLLPIPDADVRVPLQLRASATPAVGASRDDRARYVGRDVLHVTRVDYYTRWQYQAVVTLGALVHF